MELLIIGVATCLLGVLANRYGYDSRDGLRSDEERMSAQGFDWDSHADPHAAAPRVAAQPARLAPLSQMPRWIWRHHQSAC